MSADHADEPSPGGRESPHARPAPRARSADRTGVALAVAVVVGAAAGAVVIGVVLTLVSLASAGLLGVHLAYTAGPLLGAGLGASVGLIAPSAMDRARRARRLEARLDEPQDRPPPGLRALPSGRRGLLLSWALGLLLVASPFALLAVGALPPLPLWRLAATAALGWLCFLQCARVRRFWPAILIVLWPAAFVFAMDAHFPCWRGSNAEWCGHMCDGPPEEACEPSDFGVPGEAPIVD
jgi:hypothetical protein